MKFPKPTSKPKERKPLRRTKPLERRAPLRQSSGEPKTKRAPMVVRVRRLTPAEKRAILDRDEWRCRRCGLDAGRFLDLVLEARALIPSAVFVGTAREMRPALVLEALSSHGLFPGARLENVRTALVEDRPPVEVDHVEPLWRRGTNDPENLETLCADCHGEKTRAEAGQRSRLPTSRKA